MIHVRHATFYLFYAQFPNTYLRSISDYGTKYTPPPGSTKIPLYQSRPYRMRKPAHQAAFFRLLVDLFNYMTSGNSHIGYLNNNPSNPYVHRPVITLDFCIRMLMFRNLLFMIVSLFRIRRKWLWKIIRKASWMASLTSLKRTRIE